MSNQDLQLKVTLSGDGRQLSGTLKTATGEVQQFGTSSVSASATAVQGFQTVEQHTQQLDNRLGGLTGTVMKLGGAWLSYQGIMRGITAADDYGQMAARIGMATESAADYQRVQQRLLETAGGTYRSLAETQELYIQTGKSLRDLGYITSDQLDITDSLSYSFVINATSADKAASSINAFSRSLMTNKVTADDWRSMMIATPTLIENIAAATGKTSAEIRNLGATGKLSLIDLTEGLRLARDENQALSDGMALTWADANVRMSTIFGALVGQVNEVTGTTEGLARRWAGLAEQIGTLTPYVVGLAHAANGTLGEFAALNDMSDETVKTLEAVASGIGITTTALAGGVSVLIAYKAAALTATAAQMALNRAMLINPFTAALVVGGAAGAALYAYSKRQEEATVTTRVLNAETETLNNTLGRLSASYRGVGDAQLQARKNQLESMLAGIKEEIELSQQQAGAFDFVNIRLEVLQRSYNAVAADLAALNDQIDQNATTTSEAAQKTIDQLANQYIQLQLGERAYLDYQLAQQNATAAQRAQALAAFDASKALRDKIKADEDAVAAAIAHATSVKDFADSVLDALDPLREIEQQMELVWAAFDAGHLDDSQVADYVDHLIKKFKELDNVKVDPLKNAGRGISELASGINSIAGAMQGMYSEGERGYKNMAVVMQGANLLAAVGAVLQQGMGDPYTAIPRMIAMGGIVMGLGYSVGSLSGSVDMTAKRQDAQGTGTVLGDTDAKSESILRAAELTADALSELVGINRSMLDHMRGASYGADRAAASIAQLNPAANLYATQELAGDYNWIYRKDEGLDIGGTLTDLFAAAYQDIKGVGVKSGAGNNGGGKSFHSKNETLAGDISDLLHEELQQISTSIHETVKSGALSLGLLPDDVQLALDQFAIEAQKISIKGLSGEEVRDELNAVFGKIMDDVSGSVVDFLPKFQQVGEGLGETLARVATQVQVTEEAVFRLGFAADRIDPEQFARLSVYLTDAAGGLEQFISSMSGFVDKFAPESHKLDLLSADMERSLAAVGLSVPSTREEMWQLMQALDATTEAGADQIATLLRVGDTADQYYKMLEQAGMRLQALLGAQQSDALTGYLSQLADWSAAELSRIEQDYRERIALAEQQLRIGRELRQYVEQLRISELSPYDPGEKLQLATEQFAALLVRAEQGDMEAARLLQSSAQAYLQNADAYYGRSDPYLTIFEDVTRSLDRLGLDIMGGLDDNSIERLNQQMLAEQQRIRDFAQQELQWAVRQYDALTSIEQLLELLPGSLADQLQGIINKPASDAVVAPDRDGFLLAQIEQMYTHHLGRDADVEGAQYWLNLARDEGLDAVDWNIRNSEEYKKIHGSHKTGLQSVPFDGYVAELHKDERVLTAGEAKGYNQFSSDAIVSKLDELRAENAALRSELAEVKRVISGTAATAETQRDRQIRASLKTPEVI